MSYSGHVERRNLKQSGCELMVEVGVNLSRTRGDSDAKLFMSRNAVPEAVIARVLCRAKPRRRTCWECVMDEPGLRRALGARPLLPEHCPT